jgi:hypothetical protein
MTIPWDVRRTAPARLSRASARLTVTRLSPSRRARCSCDEFRTADPYFTTPGVTISQVREWAPFLE